MSSSPRRAPPQALTMPLLHRQPTPPAHTCLSYASLHPASPSCCPRRSSPRLCSSCASDSSAARPFSCASSHAGSRLYPSSCSAPAASRSHRLPRARPRTRPRSRHPPACSACGGASPVARLFSCTSFHAGPRLCPPSRSASIASRTHIDLLVHALAHVHTATALPPAAPRVEAPLQLGAFSAGPPFAPALASAFPPTLPRSPADSNGHLAPALIPASSTAICRSTSALFHTPLPSHPLPSHLYTCLSIHLTAWDSSGVDGAPLQPAQLFVHVHVLTLLGGRAPTPPGYIKRDQIPGHCRKACPLQSLQSLQSPSWPRAFNRNYRN